MVGVVYIMKIFIVNGFPGSGKTTFENYVTKLAPKYGYIVFIDSTINFVKEIARKCGWDGEKTPKNRKFLSDLKDLLTNWNDIPFKQVKQNLESFKRELQMYDLKQDQGIVFIDCREPKEIKRLCTELNAKSLLVHSEKLDMASVISNHADFEVLNFDYDIVIDNRGTLEALEQQAINFIEKDLV